jgi:alpha-galactosidase
MTSPHLKIALIGAGSYVFGPSMLSQAIIERGLNGVELALVDLDADMLDRMAGVGRAMARKLGVNIAITTHTDRATALDGASFVICSAAAQMRRRFMMDVEIINAHLPGHLVSEFGGIAGISYSLRQIALITALAAEMRRLCPDAWLLNVANPLPRVCQAAHEAGIRTIGFCSAALQGHSNLWQLWGGPPLRYPFAAATDRWTMTTAGLNHFAWVVELRERATGRDLLPDLRALLADGVSHGNPLIEHYARQTGYYLAPGDEHSRDFLPSVAGVHVESLAQAWHGDADQRAARLSLLEAVGAGERSWDVLLEHISWERPIDLIAALMHGETAQFEALNLVNDAGQIPDLPAGVFVETPCVVEGGAVMPTRVALPDSVLPLCQNVAAVTETIVRAAERRGRALLHEAVECDPTVLDKTAGREAIDACLQAHADVVGVFQ